MRFLSIKWRQGTRLFFLLLYVLAVFYGTLGAQSSLIDKKAFFKFQQSEFQQWLSATQLDQAFKTDRIEIRPEKVRLFLTAVAADDPCIFLQNSWEVWKDEFNQAHHGSLLFHEKLLKTWSTLTELPTDSVQIILHCNDPNLLRINIYGDSSGRILLEEENQQVMGSGTIPIPYHHLKSMYTASSLDSINAKLTVRKVRLAVSDYILNKWYKGKGTPILYNVRIDTTESYYNDFSFEFSHLSNEVLEEGYFEYHRIEVEVQERNERIEIDWEFTGKFGSGILFPPRRNDYKLMETYYKKDLERYEERLFKKISEFLKNLS